MILGILTLVFLSVVFRFSACRWLLMGKHKLEAGEERLCILFANLNSNLAILFSLFWLVRSDTGTFANIIVGGLSVLLLLHFVYGWIRNC